MPEIRVKDWTQDNINSSLFTVLKFLVVTEVVAHSGILAANFDRPRPFKNAHKGHFHWHEILQYRFDTGSFWPRPTERFHWQNKYKTGSLWYWDKDWPGLIESIILLNNAK